MTALHEVTMPCCMYRMASFEVPDPSVDVKWKPNMFC